MLKTIKQYFCKHEDSELIDLVSHNGSTGKTVCYYICNTCRKGHVK